MGLINSLHSLDYRIDNYDGVDDFTALLSQLLQLELTF